MELRHLRYFVAAAEELHFSRAAETLSVTRPAVSQTIADLETELGVHLFLREAQKVRLTAAGEVFLRHARAILGDVATATQTTRRVGQGRQGLLTVGYGSLGLRHPLFREAIKRMGGEYPDTDLALKELVSRAQIDEVRSGRLDAGFVYVARREGEGAPTLPGPESISDLGSFRIEAGGIGVALPRGHAMAGAETLDLADLKDEGFILVGSSLVNTHFPFVPKIVQEVANISTQINLISVGMGVGLVVVSPRLQYPDDIHVIPLKGRGPISEFRLVWRKGAIEPILENFIAIVRTLAKGG